MIFLAVSGGPRHQNAARLRIARTAAEPPRGPPTRATQAAQIAGHDGMDGAELVRSGASSASPASTTSQILPRGDAGE